MSSWRPPGRQGSTDRQSLLGPVRRSSRSSSLRQEAHGRVPPLRRLATSTATATRGRATGPRSTRTGRTSRSTRHTAYYNAAEHTPTNAAASPPASSCGATRSTRVLHRQAGPVRVGNRSWLHEDPNDYWWRAYVGGRQSSTRTRTTTSTRSRATSGCGETTSAGPRAEPERPRSRRMPPSRRRGAPLKSGVEVVYNELDAELTLGSLIPSAGDTSEAAFRFFDWDRALYTDERYQHNIYKGFPTHGAMYLQDQMNYEGMIVRGGLQARLVRSRGVVRRSARVRSGARGSRRSYRRGWASRTRSRTGTRCTSTTAGSIRCLT